MGAPVTVEELEIVIRAKVGEALAGMQQVINRMEKLIGQQLPRMQTEMDAAMQKADRVIDRDAGNIILSIDRLDRAQTSLNYQLERTARLYDETFDRAREYLTAIDDANKISLSVGNMANSYTDLNQRLERTADLFDKAYFHASSFMNANLDALKIVDSIERLTRVQIQLNQQLEITAKLYDKAFDYRRGQRNADKETRQVINALKRIADQQEKLNKRIDQTADRYDKALKHAQSFLSGVIKGMSQGMKDVAKNTDRAGKETDKLNQKVKKTGSSYNWLTGQIRGMIVSMALYGVIDLFTTSVSNAATEMAKLDEETNEMLSSYKSSFEYAQMSFGTAMLPLLEAAEPLVTSIADGFAEVSNYIGMFFAALNGQTTYNKVIKKTADYLEDTADAAEEVKRSIAGFDELNIIGQEDVESGWEIEEVEIPQWMQTLGKYIDAETLAMGALGLGIAGLLGKLSKLTQGFKDKNKTLDEQTKKTKTDAEAVKELAESFTPALLGAGDLTQSLVSLGALTILPTIDLSLFDESTGRMLESIDLAADRLDELGLLRPAPQLDNTPMEETVEAGKTIIDDYNAYEVNGKVAEMDNAPLMESADATEQRIAELDEVNPVQKTMPEIDRASEFNPSAQDITQTVDDLNSLELEQMVFKAIETTELTRSVGEIDSLLGQVVASITETINVYSQLQQAIGGTGVPVSQHSASGQQLEWMTGESSANNIVMQSGITAIQTAAAQKSTAEAIQKANETAEEAAKAAKEASAKASETPSEITLNPNQYQSIISGPVGRLVASNWDKEGSRYNQTEITESDLESAIDAVNTTSKYGAKIAVDLAASALGGAIAGMVAEAVQSSGSKAMDVLNDAIGNTTNSATILPTIPAKTTESASAVGKAMILQEIQRYLKPAAYGAVAFKPTPLLTGEYPGASMNPEIVAPQNMIYDTVVQANGELVSAMYSMIREVIAAIEANTGGDVYLDSRKITSSVIDGIKAEKRRTGRSPI